MSQQAPQEIVGHHPLLPLRNLLILINSSVDFTERKTEILTALSQAAPCLDEYRLKEIRTRMDDVFLPRRGSLPTPHRMARLIETVIGEAAARSLQELAA